MSNFADIRALLMARCAEQATGLRSLRLMFQKFDRNANGSLDAKEFKEAMAYFGVPLNELEAGQCLKYFDTNKDGKLSFNEFLGAVRGELNAVRRDAVH
jgi:Ca2+-binding EF-hand superfamily protein